MLRRAALYGVPNSGAEWHKCYSALLLALERRFGYGRVWQRNSKYYSPEDVADDVAVAVIFGQRDGAKGFLQRNLELNIPTLVIDLAWLRRDLGYWQVSLGGLNNPPPYAPSSARFDRLGIQVFERLHKIIDYSVVICGQLPGDAQHDLASNVDMLRWARKAADDVKRLFPHTEQIFWRPHPKAIMTLGKPTIMTSPDRSVQNLLRESHVGSAVVYNSNLGVELLRNGISVIAQGPRTVYTDLVSSDIADLKTSHPGSDKVRSLLERLAYGQYTTVELSDWGTLERLLELHSITGDW